ncbi:MAG: Gfo/Idh/MocA family oxidoreductase [Gemmatimonadota bacterium]|nr:MAG: Gfo/Idh/MocA family oxidoreductase [Gemmatimonadota bacterium]
MAKTVTVGLIGAGFIGQMHSLTFKSAGATAWTPAITARLKTLAERDETLGREIAARYGWETWTADWRDIVTDPEIDLVINAGPNHLHKEPSIASARAGKHVFCEKPLAGTADEAFEIWQGVAGTGVNHLCAFTHRSIPALELARQMIDAGELGEIRHYRSRFLLNMLTPDAKLSWRFSRSKAGLGALGDLGSHHIDQARFLVGEIKRVGALTKTWSRDAAGQITDVNDDAFVCAAELENGATASFEASRVAGAHNLGGWIEVDGTERSIAFHMERLNELTIYEPGRGPRTQMITKEGHPYSDFWLPIGIQGQHPLGWNDCFVHQARHMLEAVALGNPVAPRATFEDGYRVAETVDAIARSAASGRFEEVRFRS